MKVIHQGFTDVKNAHTKIDLFIKVKCCLLHGNGDEVFIEDRASIKVCIGCWFFGSLDAMTSIEYQPYF